MCLRNPSLYQCAIGVLAVHGLTAAPAGKNVLMINSYHAGYVWTDALVGSANQMLREAPFPVNFWVEFLDSGRVQGAAYLSAIELLLQQKYTGKRIDLILAADDFALEFLLPRRISLFGDVPVVFLGINQPELAGRAPPDRYTGLIEVFHTEALLDLVRTFHPETQRIYVVTDGSLTGASQHDTYRQIAGRRKDLDFVFLDGRSVSLPAILVTLSSVQSGSVVIASGFDVDAAGTYHPRGEAVAAIAARSAAPVYSPSNSTVGQGLVAGTDNTGIEHGRLGAAIAIRILEGVSPASIPVTRDASNRFIVDYQQIRRWGIPPGRIPPDALVVNRPDSFYQTYRSRIWAASALIAGQAAVIAALFLSRSRRKRVEAELRQKAAELKISNDLLQQVNHSLSEENTARTRAQTMLERLSMAVDQLTDGVAIITIDGRYLYINHWFAALYGKPREFFPGRHYSEVEGSESARSQLDQWNSDLASNGKFEAVVERKTPDGKARLYRTANRMFLDEDGKPVGVVVIISDVTQQTLMEDQLRQAQKMEAIGRLAGGVAHDFNNLLTVINGYGELVRQSLPAGDENHGPVSEIVKAGHRATALTRQLLAFSRRHVVQAKPVDINARIDDLERMLHRLIGEHIHLVTIKRSSGSVVADAGQVDQVILNLALNARDAMPSGGTLTISTDSRSLARGHPDLPMYYLPGRYSVVMVADTGAGMNEETRARAFEPFFTTKEKGQGTGMGLATAYGIVDQAGGWIRIESEPGHGATFSVFLPQSDQPAEQPGDASEPVPKAPVRPAATVLVVEDEAEVRRLAVSVLARAGFDVLEAASPAQGLEVCRQYSGPVDVLLTDVVMPGMTGGELADQVRLLRPNIRVVFMSGYADRVLDGRDLASSGERFLQKPFGPAGLVAEISQALQTVT